MNFFHDVRTVLGKEWSELSSSDSGWVTLSTLGVFVAVIGVYVPWQLGTLWLDAPWPIVIWAWIPLFIVTTVTSDSVAGERERRTLETLLATRLSDASILWGKWLACVLWVWAAMAVCLPIGILTLNLSVPGGPHLPSFGHAAGMLTVAFAGAGLGAAVGVLVSLKAESVRHAQQVLAIGALVFAFVPVALAKMMPVEWTAGVFSMLMNGSPARVSWVVAAFTMLLTLPILGVASMRFQRGKIQLK
jgi:ABC-2 type transport system permease protein